MNSELLLCLALVLSGGFARNVCAIEFTNSPTLTNSEQNFQSLAKLVEQRKFYPAHDFYWQQKGVFSQDQRTAIFLLAAKMLNITNDAELHLGQVDTSDLHFLGNLLLADYFTIQDGITYRDHGITNFEAIPYLITALTNIKNEDPRLVDQDSSAIDGMLWALTRRYTGSMDDENRHFFIKNHQAVVDWWQNWWKENKNRHPVFDADLEELLRNEVLKLDDKIMRVKPPTNIRWDSTIRFELENNGSLYSDNEWNGGPPNSVFTFYYGHPPGIIPDYEYYASGRIDDVLCIHGEFLTKSLFSKKEPPYGISANKKFPMREIYSETVKGTGIAIKVEITTTNKTLIEVLKKQLNEK